MATISENIKRMRAKQGLTQDDLAKKASIKYSTLTKIEVGIVTKPSVQTIQKIAKSLGVSMEDLLDIVINNSLSILWNKKFSRNYNSQ